MRFKNYAVSGSLLAILLSQAGHSSPPLVQARSPIQVPATASAASVLQHHKNPGRDGLYVDPLLSRANLANGLSRSFSAALNGPTYAQPLFVESGSRGKDIVIVATEQNQVSAFDAATGAVVWQKSLGVPVPLSSLQCGNIDPLGITGTPIVDPATKTLFLDAMVLDGRAGSPQHQIFALSVEDGSIRSGWPVTVKTALSALGMDFKPEFQNQRGALGLLNGRIYVPYGGHFGDCGDYHGWVVSVSSTAPTQVSAWKTGAHEGGAWAPSGVASDGTSIFIGTGNTDGATTWVGGDAVIRLAPGPVFTQNNNNFFAPLDWPTLDQLDRDLGSAGPVTFDLAGSTPSQLVLEGGKSGALYLLDRNHLGGVSIALTEAQVASNSIITSPAVYSTNQGAYAVVKAKGSQCPSGQSGDLLAVRLIPGNPPTFQTAWCALQSGKGSPMVSTTNGASDAIVWSLGSEGDNLLHAFDGDTGRPLFTANPGTPLARFQTPMSAKGTLYVAGNTALVAFHAPLDGPGPSPSPTPSPTRVPPVAASTFRQISRDILLPRCVTCHSGPNPASAINLTAYAGVAGEVQAGNPGASTLWQAVSNGSMPPGGPRLSPAEVKKIGDWITAGARNN